MICEKVEKSDIATIDKKKYLVPADLTVGQFVYVIRKRIKLSPEKAIFIFVDEVLPPTAALMSSIYEEHKDEDGYVAPLHCALPQSWPPLLQLTDYPPVSYTSRTRARTLSASPPRAPFLSLSPHRYLTRRSRSGLTLRCFYFFGNSSLANELWIRRGQMCEQILRLGRMLATNRVQRMSVKGNYRTAICKLGLRPLLSGCQARQALQSV